MILASDGKASPPWAIRCDACSRGRGTSWRGAGHRLRGLTGIAPMD